MTAPRLDLAAEPKSVGQARSFVAQQLRGWGLEGCVEVATLLASELATNVVVHAHTPFAVVVRRTAVGACVDVLDSSTTLPTRQPHDPSAPHGRGLVLLDGLATSWGPVPASDLEDFAKGIRFCVS